MSNICKTVTLRKRPIKNGTMQSLYLDYYPGYRDESTMKVQRHESLGIYIYSKPKNQRERDYNDSMMEKGEAIRCRRFESVVNERYDFFDREKMKGDFLAYFEKKAKEKNKKWENVYKHFYAFCQGKCRFDEINVELCNRFMQHLFTTPQTLHKEQKLHINTIAGYWSTFRAVLHTAYRDHKIQENPNGYLEKIDTIPTEKEHLAQPELVKLAETECKEPELKKAFLFACLTGLRKSDVMELTWKKIQPYGNGGMYIPDELQPLITFHGSRHTFGSLQADAGTSIYVIQRILGHKNVETTQIYADMSDETKRQSVDRITLKPKVQPLSVVKPTGTE